MTMAALEHTCVVFILLQLNVTDRDSTQATHTEDPSSWIPSKSLSKPSCLWGKHTDYCIQLSSPGSFPFCPERVPFRSHTAAICLCHWSCSFPADHSFSSDGSCRFMFGWQKMDIVKRKPPWSLRFSLHTWFGDSFDLLPHRQMIFRAQIEDGLMCI